MPARKIIARGIFIALMLVLLGAITWMVLGPRSKLTPSQRMPDGTVVSITKVYYGKSVTIPKGKRWQRLAAQILPSAIARRLGVVNSVKLPADTTLIFVQTHRTNGTFNANPMVMGFTYNTAISMSDDVGNDFGLGGPAIQYYGPSANTLIQVFRAPLISHLATNLHLHLTQSDFSVPYRSSQNSDFTVPNPAPRSKSHWPAGHLPITNQSDELTVVLTGFERNVVTNTFLGGTNFSPFTSPQLQFFENGVFSTNWHLLNFSVQDEETNRLEWAGSGHYSSLETRKWRFEVYGTLPIRREDILTISNVPVVNDQDGWAEPVSGDFDGHTIQISRVSRSHSNINVNPPFGDRDRNVLMTITSGDQAWDLRANVKRLSVGSSGSTGLGFWPMPKDVKTVDVTFEFPRTTNRSFEFIARPETVKR